MKLLFDFIVIFSISFLIGDIFRSVYPADRTLAVRFLIAAFLVLLGYCIRVGIIKIIRK